MLGHPYSARAKNMTEVSAEEHVGLPEARGEDHNPSNNSHEEDDIQKNEGESDDAHIPGSVEWYEDLRATRPLIILGYRGGWSQYCEANITAWEDSCYDNLCASGFEIYAVTTESPSSVTKTQKKWMTKIPLVSCEDTDLIDHLNASKEINIVVTETDLDNYPCGELVQPFIFITTPSQILYTWAAPKPANLVSGTAYLEVFLKIISGEKEFPDPVDVFDLVKEEMLTGNCSLYKNRSLVAGNQDFATSFCKGTSFLCTIGQN